MKLLVLIAIIAAATLGTLIATSFGEEQPAPAAASPKITVGVFDSRAVVIAYANSEMFKRTLKDARERHKTAKAAGDEETASAIEAEMTATQKEFHHQCFAATPVDNLLELIRDEIPAIAKTAGVDLIVSKWQIVHQAEGAEVVDITLALIEPFKPGEEALQTIGEIKDQKPVPIEDLEDHED